MLSSKQSKSSFRTELTNCALCGLDQGSVLFQAGDRLGVTSTPFTFVRCTNCGLVYLNPRVTPETIGTFYPDYSFSSRPGRRARGAAQAARKVARKCSLIESFAPNPGTLLEIGSANGDFLKAMQERGWCVEGVEISAQAAQYSRETHKVVVYEGDLLGRPDDGRRFDVIVLWAVMPHISDPISTIRAAERLLTPAGRIIVCCCNIDSEVADRMRERWGHLDTPRHYCMWSPSTLAKLYAAAGLKVVAVRHHYEIFHAHLVFPWRGRFRLTGRRLSRLVRWLTYPMRALAGCLNTTLTRRAVVAAQLAGRGGIITVVGQRST